MLKINGISVNVINGDIASARADSIVNAANRFLQHGGGVALALIKRGGMIIQKESDEFIAKHGPLKKGEVAITTAGNLSAKRVIHTVGPIYGEGTLEDLVEAYAAAISSSDALGDAILAVPAVSAGTYGFPIEESAKALYLAINKLKIKALKEIDVYIKDIQQYTKFSMALKNFAELGSI